MKKKICLTALVIAMLLLITALPVSAGKSTAWVIDRADILNNGEVDDITAAAEAAREATGCDFYIVTHYESVRYDEYWGDDFLRDYGLSANDDIVVLIITCTQYEYFYDLYTYGDAYDRINDKEVNYILDDEDVYDNLKSGELGEGALAFLPLAAKAYSGRVGASYVTIAIVSFVISLVIGLIVCFCVKRSYSMRAKSVDYPLDRFAKMELTAHSDVFTGSFVTKRVIQSSSSGGRSGGGGSRGGGGGHRGGR